MKIAVPEKVLSILNELTKSGFESYVVGGCVRDALLSRKPNDWDITTNARPEDVKRIFEHTVDTGIKHGTVSVLLKGEAFEVTTYRVDGKYEDGRHPREVFFSGSLEEDLKRRDFTVNAMAYNVENGLVDLFGGQEDLKAGIIRCVGDPGERFSEDALRIMRCVRFAAQLGFQIEEKTKEGLIRFSERLSMVSAERIRMELEKLITSDDPGMIRVLYETGQTKVFLPEFDKCMETPQNNRHHFCSVGEHTILCLKNTPADLVLRMAALLHDIGKPETRTTDENGEDHFYHHPEAGAGIAKKILSRLRFDNHTSSRILRLVRYHDDNPPLDNEGAVRRAMARCKKDSLRDLFILKRADAGSKHRDYIDAELEYIDRYEALSKEILSRGDPLEIKDLAITGKDLIENGMKKGPEIGKALDTAMNAVLKKPEKNEKSSLLGVIKNAGFFCLILILSVITLSGCSFGEPEPAEAVETEAAETEALTQELTAEDEFDGNGVLCEIDTVKMCIKIRDLSSDKEKTYVYTDETEFLDKYDGFSNLSAFQPGEIADYSVYPDEKTLGALRISSGISRIERLKKYEIDKEHGIFTFEGDNYKLKNDTPVFLGEDDVSLDGIREGDELRVYLNDRDVCSMRIMTGFGTIVLKNTKLFEGGYLNLDNTMYYRVTAGMEIEAAEGKHEITVANDGYGDSMIVNVLRNEAVAVKLDALEGEGPKFCELKIVLMQPEATVTLDGKQQDVSKPISVRYGAHRLTVEMEGYEPWTRTLVANSETASIEIDLSGGEEQSSGSSSSGSSSSGEAATESLSDQIIEAAMNGVRPSGDTSTATSDAAADAATQQDFNDAYLDTLTNMFTTLAGTGDDDEID